ncbi:aldo/keto reductase [Alteribacter aurantiacus]|uniref:aldo/keto reductase n=1 Tax=Alteribacter aurantiacus TaxID=254410 RepID=UPI0004165D94|nr:aldo/keto reductase [Alteribacter aurantiacus]
MKKNRIGSSDLHATEIGFGCMSLSNNQLENEKIIHEAIDRGVNYFDTADLYEFGANEESVGKALKGKRQDVILASKGGNEWGTGIDGWRWNPSKEHLKNAVKDSLKRLQTDYLDLYQLHGGTIDDPIDETIEAFEDLVKEGTIRYYGISSIRPNVIKEYATRSNIVSVMMQYSLLDRRPEELFSLLNDHTISVIARGPVAKGLLAHDYERKLSDEGYLNYNRDELTQTIKKLEKVAKEEHMNLNELALRYVLGSQTVACTVPGASEVAQVEGNILATQVNNLSPDTIEFLQTITKESQYDKHRE